MIWTETDRAAAGHEPRNARSPCYAEHPLTSRSSRAPVRAIRMTVWNVGPKNGNWKGGRSVASNGYVLIRVGKDHHLADVRGYAYEHRLVAEQKIGRRLKPGEQVHHVDGNRENNDPLNLEVEESFAHHKVHHRKPGGKRLRLPGEANPTLACACGCGETFPRYDGLGRLRAYVSGHNEQPSPTEDAIMTVLRDGPEERSVIVARAGRRGNVVGTSLNKLRLKGMAVRLRRGRWAARRCVRCMEASRSVELRLHVVNTYCRPCFESDRESVPPPHRDWEEGVVLEPPGVSAEARSPSPAAAPATTSAPPPEVTP